MVVLSSNAIGCALIFVNRQLHLKQVSIAYQARKCLSYGNRYTRIGQEQEIAEPDRDAQTAVG